MNITASRFRGKRLWFLVFVTLYKMSYDTEHVRNAGNTPGTITGIPTFAELFENPSLADLYTSIKRVETATAPNSSKQRLSPKNGVRLPA